MKYSTKKLTTVAMLIALSMVVNMLLHFPIIPSVSFLKYDPKDIIIVIGGFIYGPLTTILISVICSFLELFFRAGDLVDVLMNVISTCAFACTAAAIYRKQHTKKGATIGLISGVIAMTLIMLVWNYVVTPLYYHMPRVAVIGMLPAIGLFNIIKSGINAVLTLLLYKPIVTIFRKTNLVEKADQDAVLKNESMILIGFVVVTIVCVILTIIGLM